MLPRPCCAKCEVFTPTSAWCTGRGESLLHDGRLQEVLGHNVLPVMRLLHAHMAAACAHLAKLLRAHRGHQKVCPIIYAPLSTHTCTFPCVKLDVHLQGCSGSTSRTSAHLLIALGRSFAVCMTVLTVLRVYTHLIASCNEQLRSCVLRPCMGSV